ncbi:hypothetical protein ACOMHN_028590 [Nucella lapillus]
MCTTFIAKLVLGLVNTAVFLVGLAMFIIGLLIHTQPEFSKDSLKSLLGQLESSADKAGVSLDTSDFSVAEVAYSFTIALIVVGLFLAGISILGIIAVKYSLKPLLIVYFLITLVLFLAQLTLVLIAAIDRGVFDDAVKPRLKTTIENYYEGFESKDPTSQIWNGIMIQLQCCGVDSSKDFDKASKWSKMVKGQPVEIPLACCKTVSSNYSCAQTPTDTTTSNKDTGCYIKMWDYLLSNSGIVISIATIVLFAQLVILLLTCIVMNSIGKVGV